MRTLSGIVCAMAFAGVVISPAPRAQAPERPITVVVPNPPGAGLDYVARTFASRFESRYGQRMIVENRTGAGGYTGSAYVARAAPDGQTLLVNFLSSVIVNAVQTQGAAVDLLRTLSPIAVLGVSEQYLWASGTIPVKNVTELIAYAKKNPGKLNFAGVSNSIDEALYTPQFLLAAGIRSEIASIPYNGMADVVRALLSAESHLVWVSLAVGKPHLASGKMVALGVRGTERAAQMPDTPTIREQGLDFVGASHEYSLFGPSGLSPEVLASLNKRVYAAMDDAAVREALLKSGVNLPRPETPAELAARFAKDAKEIPEGIARFAKKP